MTLIVISLPVPPIPETDAPKLLPGILASKCLPAVLRKDLPPPLLSPRWVNGPGCSYNSAVPEAGFIE